LKYIDKKINYYENLYNIEIKYNKIKLKGIKEIEIDKIFIYYKIDTLLYIDNINLKFKLYELLIKRSIGFNDLNVNNLFFHFVRKDSVSNYSFIFERHNDNNEKIEKNGVTLAEKWCSIMEIVFGIIPDNMEISNSSIKYMNNDSLLLDLSIPYIRLTDKRFSTIINVSNRGSIISSGNINNRDKEIDLSLINKDGYQLPYVDYKYGIGVNFDTALLKLNYKYKEDNNVWFEGNMSLINGVLNYRRISNKPVELSKVALKYKMNVTGDDVEIDSSSEVSINKILFNPYIKLRFYPYKSVLIKIRKDKLESMDLFSSLPKGLFNNFEGIKTEGSFSFNLFFEYDSRQVDSLKFVSDFSSKDFKILKYGVTDFSLIRDNFKYNIYDNNGRYVRSKYMGEGSEDYVKLEDISDYLKNSVITAEDGMFRYHKGFDEYAFKLSIIRNIKEKRFAKGGSTITMQLVKNLFLNRNKTIARKLEEALIVWIIENKKILSKDRILEIYLNAIEWGPNVYGINEASWFYFDKPPIKLNLAESIFLSLIIPNPKNFMYYFDDNGNMKSFVYDYYKFISKKLLSNGKITQEEYDELFPVVYIRGHAKKFLINNLKIYNEFNEDFFD